MQKFVVTMTLKLVVEADNPGSAVSDTVIRLQKLLETHDPLLLSSMLREAVAYPAAKSPGRI